MPAGTTPITRVLLLEGDTALRTQIARDLEAPGLAVTSVAQPGDALRILTEKVHDVVVAEIARADPGSADFLEAMRDVDSEIPVILLTDAPDLESAVLAVNHGAYRYLVKPIPAPELERLVRRAGKLRSLARLRHAAMEAVDAEDERRRHLDLRVSRALDALWMAYQPIVVATGWRLLGYEALLRSDDDGFTNAEELLHAAHRLDRTSELGRRVRAAVARDLPRLPADSAVFVNVLPGDLLDPDLFAPSALLSQHAQRVVLELTERASFEAIPDLHRRLGTLRALGFRIALDDLGAGSSGLTSLTALEPDLVKLDRSLIRDVHLSTHRQAVVRSVVALCRSLDIAVIGEGVEREDEERMLRGLEVQHLQGFRIAAPHREIRAPLARLA